MVAVGLCCRCSRPCGANRDMRMLCACPCVQAGGLVTSPNDTRRAIQSIASGLPVPAPAVGGACDATVMSSVRYGYNTTSSCSYSLTATQLENFCV